MPIVKNGSNEIIFTPPNRGDLFDQTGVAHATQFAICDDIDLLKQLKFSTSGQSTNTSTTIASNSSQSTDIIITLPAVSGTLNNSGVTGTFKTVQTSAGTSPVASGPNDVLTLSSSDSSVTTTGNSSTDTVDFVVASVGTSSAANVHSAELLANAATSSNTPSTIVKRDGSGNFSAGTITASLTGVASGNVINSRIINTSSPLTGGGNLSSDLTLAINTANTSQPGALSAADWNTFNSKQASGNYVTALTGDGTASGPGSAALTLATVNSNVGSFGSATAVGGFTVNGKGLVTAASSTPIQITESQVTSLVSDLAAKVATTGITNAQLVQFFGDGSDGNVTISGVVTLTRDMFYNNLTISAGAALNPSGFKIFVLGTLDLTAAPAGSILRNGAAGTTASSSSGGSGGATNSNGSLGGSGAGSSGGASGTTFGSPGITVSGNVNNGGISLNGGIGGTGAAGVQPAGAGGVVVAATTLPIRRLEVNLQRSTTPINGGGSGAGGGGGGGTGALTGGGGGGGGSGGALIFIAANTLSRGGSTAVGAIQLIGMNGGGGFSPANATGGGGGGGSAGGGGWFYLYYATISGSTATNAIDLSSGSGGNGGNGNTTGAGGNGGGSGGTGRATFINISTGVVTESFGGAAGVAGSAASGATGGAGASGSTYQVSL